MNAPTLVIRGDHTGFVAGWRTITGNRASFTFRHPVMTPGAEHIAAVLAHCAQRRLTVEQTALKLLVAADFADVLDRSAA